MMAKHIFDPMTNRKPTARRTAVSQVADEIADLQATIARMQEERDTAITDSAERIAELLAENRLLHQTVQALLDEVAYYVARVSDAQHG